MNRPLTTLVNQGWEVLQYSAGLGDSGMQEHCVLLKKGREHRILRMRKKMMGGGMTAEELDV